MMQKKESPQEQPLLSMNNVKVHFGKIIALDGVNFSVGENEVVGLLGNNGAGKSTLVKALLGYHPKAAGDVFFEGRQADFRSPREARSAGIETVFQDFSLAEDLSIVENFFIGREIARGINVLGFRDSVRMESIAEQALRELGLRKPISMQAKVSSLSGGERQLIAIGRALFFARKLLILDEPTSALSESSVQLLRDKIKEARGKGISVIFATHQAPEVFEVADRFVILDNGRLYASLKKEDTDIVQLEKVLISTRLSAVKEMAAGVAHQVRNPLGVLRVSVELLKNKFDAACRSEEFDSIITVMLSEIDNLNHVINNFMDFAHQRELLKAPSSIAEVIRESVDSLPIAAFPDVAVRVIIREEIGAYSMDSNLIKQAISNIVMNAIDASSEKGNVEIRVFPAGKCLCVEVQDWGCGMEEEQKRRIFMPFFTTKMSGTGLGLSIAHRIVEQHSGSIEVSSSPGKGSTFRILL
jgi:simple sugar transport system ATP-binding protein